MLWITVTDITKVEAPNGMLDKCFALFWVDPTYFVTVVYADAVMLLVVNCWLL